MDGRFAPTTVLTLISPFRRRNNLREQQQVLQRQQLQRQLQQQQDLRRQLSQGVEQPRVLQRPVANPAAAVVPLPVDAAAVEVAREVQDILRSGGGGEAAEEDVSEEFPGSRELLRWLLSSNFDPTHFR